MKVSVIVTTHNTERYLLKCMDSIFNQTLSDIEIIIADDESQVDMLIPILEDVPEGEHYGYGRAATEIQEKTDIVYDEQQPLLALIYDNDEARTFDFSYIVNDQLDALEMDDYVYYFSFEFRTE